MNDLDLSKLTSLVAVQKKFPNDDLRLFETVKTSLNVNQSPSFRQIMTDTKNSWSSMQRKQKNDSKLNAKTSLDFLSLENQNSNNVRSQLIDVFFKIKLFECKEN